jgi:hypothetical protein
MRGNLSTQGHQQECQRVRDMLAADARPHLREFLEVWQQA